MVWNIKKSYGETIITEKCIIKINKQREEKSHENLNKQTNKVEKQTNKDGVNLMDAVS